MTENEWEVCTDTQAMLHFLHAHYRHLSPRKLLLFAASCCESILNYSTEPQIRQAVATLAQFAEGKATETALGRACKDAEAVWLAEFGCDYVSAAVWEATRLAATDPVKAAIHAAQVAGAAAECRAGHGTREAEGVAQGRWLRDIFPSPYRPKLIKRAWLGWNDGMIPKLAQAIYERRTFEWMPELANALEGANCTNQDMLVHCREPGLHVRGCWVLDLFLCPASNAKNCDSRGVHAP
jgi:hypothetical protein